METAASRLLFTVAGRFRADQPMSGGVSLDEEDQAEKRDEGEGHHSAPKPRGNDEEKNRAGSRQAHAEDGEDAPRQDVWSHGCVHSCSAILPREWRAVYWP